MVLRIYLLNTFFTRPLNLKPSLLALSLGLLLQPAYALEISEEEAVRVGRTTVLGVLRTTERIGSVIGPMLAHRGDTLPVSALPCDGTWPTGTSQWEKRNIAAEVPEVQAVIAVEVMGDAMPEADEVFYLDVTNPVGGSFGPGVVTLTAMRTIVNDDGGWIG